MMGRPGEPRFPRQRCLQVFDRRIVTFCDGGGNGAFTALALQELGYRNVATLDGGFFAWVGAGMPVVPASGK